MKLRSTVIVVAVAAFVAIVIGINIAYGVGSCNYSSGSPSSPVPGEWVADPWFIFVCYGGF